MNISYTGCLGLFPAISLQFTALQLDFAKKFTKTLVLGGSRSFKVINVNISKKLVASACYNKQHVRAYLQPFSQQTSQ